MKSVDTDVATSSDAPNKISKHKCAAILLTASGLKDKVRKRKAFIYHIMENTKNLC